MVGKTMLIEATTSCIIQELLDVSNLAVEKSWENDGNSCRIAGA
jgi:hypothetical protein